MNVRFKISIIIAAILLAVSHPGFLFSQDQRSNVLFIFADDLAYDAVGFMGNDRVETPNLDRLAKRGTVFTHAFNSGAWGGAVCVASRTMLMTGKQLWNANATKPAEAVTARQFWPQRMEDAGYSTWFAGKWHVGNDKLVGESWQHHQHVRPGMPNQVDLRYHRNFTPGEDDWSPTDTSLDGFWKGGRHWSEVLADDCDGFMTELQAETKPFFMMLAFNAPHDPRQAPQEYQDRYPYDSITVPHDFLAEYPHDFGANKIRDEQLAPFPRTEHSIRVCRSEYYALITHMDAQIGRMLDALEKSGKADNTVIIFTADHGLACGHHGMMGKQNQYDHSARVPWIIAGPGIPAGQRREQMIYLQDAMATTLELAGADRIETDEFSSVLPVVRGEQVARREAVYGGYMDTQRMVRTETHKLVTYPKAGVELLFDLQADPDEMNNLATDPQQAELLKDMQSRLQAEMKKMNEPDTGSESLAPSPPNQFRSQ